MSDEICGIVNFHFTEPKLGRVLLGRLSSAVTEVCEALIQQEA